MRTVGEIRTRLLNTLHGAVQRPVMYGGRAWCVELFLWNILSDLCYIDEREQELRDIIEQWVPSSSTGVPGCFHQRIINVHDFGNEMGSIYAEIAARLGYLTLQRRLPPAEWMRLKSGLRKSCRDRDWRASEIREQYGEPSLVAVTVYCYASSDKNTRWVFFDFSYSEARSGRQRDYILRNARIPAASFARELVFTPSGMQYKRKNP